MPGLAEIACDGISAVSRVRGRRAGVSSESRVFRPRLVVRDSTAAPA
ncbi:MAG: hypothetical protein JWN54_800 [Mycobacterium sp.]|nr:hypothetical protein [Mycobacterium sp.]